MPEDINIKKSLPEDPKEKPEGDPEGQKTDKSEDLKGKLNQALGKSFPSEESALKAVKDTFDYVGKAGKSQKAIKAVMEAKGVSEEEAVSFITDSVKEEKGNFVSKEEFNQNAFYSEHPEYKDYKRIVETWRRANPTETREIIVASDDFKEQFDKIKSHDEAEKQKSVLHSNPRLGAVKDKLSQAKESYNKGNFKKAGDTAVDAVLDQYPQK